MGGEDKNHATPPYELNPCDQIVLYLRNNLLLFERKLHMKYPHISRIIPNLKPLILIMVLDLFCIKVKSLNKQLELFQ